MSDKISTASNTVITQLTENLNTYMCMSYGVRMFCWLVLFCILTMFMSSLLPMNNYMYYEKPRYRSVCMEEFGNENELYPFQLKKVYKFKRAQLTAPLDENKNPENIRFGHLDVYVIPSDDDNMTYKLQSFANLAILDGNIYNFNNEKTNQKYTLMLTNGKDFVEFEYKKDNDGLYKIDYETTNQKEISKLLEYKIVHVHHYSNELNKIILVAKL